MFCVFSNLVFMLLFILIIKTQLDNFLSLRIGA